MIDDTPRHHLPRVVALDLERTLIDDALSARPRPGLFDFLRYCHERFDRVALFTTVETDAAREVLVGLERQGFVPSQWLDRLEFVDWHGEYKDLAFVSDVAVGEVVLLDDDEGWIRPDQRERWVEVLPWDGSPGDRELTRLQTVLSQRYDAVG